MRLSEAALGQRELAPSLETSLEVPLRFGMTDQEQAHAQETRARRPHERHVQSSYSLPGQPADSLWKIQTSGAAKITSKSQRRRAFWRCSIAQSQLPQRLHGGVFSAATDAGLPAPLNYRSSSMNWCSIRAVAPQMRWPLYEKAGTSTWRPW